ncbi:MAG: hypothetical protein ACI4GZ_05150 [Ruminococcus sp.]
MKFEMINYVMIAMGVFLLAVGIVVWAGKRVDLVHGEKASKIREEDKGKYSALLGLGIIVMALTVVVYGVLTAIENLAFYYRLIIIGTGGGISALILILSYKKYFNNEDKGG